MSSHWLASPRPRGVELFGEWDLVAYREGATVLVSAWPVFELRRRRARLLRCGAAIPGWVAPELGRWAEVHLWAESRVEPRRVVLLPEGLDLLETGYETLVQRVLPARAEFARAG